jgi:PadR family transcriptional regulator PadR
LWPDFYIGRLVGMVRRPSPETASVLAALAREPMAWRYGYELGKEVGLEAGTLYPILMRLCDRGLLEAAWEVDPPVGRPRRHMYRITAAGERAANEAHSAVAKPPVAVPAHRHRTAFGARDDRRASQARRV